MALGAAGLLGACAPQRDFVGLSSELRSDDAVSGLKRHRILVATTRRRSEDATEMFSGDRGTGLSFASVDVTVPSEHEIGRLELPRQGVPDPSRHFTIEAPRRLGSASEFRSKIGEELLERPVGKRNVVLFVHGFNQTFSRAVLNLGKFIEDSGYAGVPVLFSWASAGRSLDYLYDLNSAIIARDAFMQVNRFTNIPAMENYEIFAHSMGNVVVMEALRQGILTGRPLRPAGLSGIVLASPDIDFDLFRAQLAAIPPEARDFVVLTSQDDRALSLSQRLAGGKVRVGRADPDVLRQLGVSVIDLSAVSDKSSTHHSKYMNSPEFVRLVGERLLDGDQFGRPSEATLVQSISLGIDGTINVIGDGLGQ